MTSREIFDDLELLSADDAQERRRKSLEAKFARLSASTSPGEVISRTISSSPLGNESLVGDPVDFTRGDVSENAFEPIPGALDKFVEGQRRGSTQAYTEHRGEAGLRHSLSSRLSEYTGGPAIGEDELIISPGTQGALFLAASATIAAGDKVAIIQPDYFGIRKLVAFLGGDIVPIELDYLESSNRAGINLAQLESSFKEGVKIFIFSNPNNPTGVIYSPEEIQAIAEVANRYGVTVLVDQLYCRLLYPGYCYSHLRATEIDPAHLITIMGPSKTESLSGYRVGVAVGPARLISRMEKLQAIVSLRAAGYCQAVLQTWFSEPAGWLKARIQRHMAIRDDLVSTLKTAVGLVVRSPEAGSYMFPRLPALSLSGDQFQHVLQHQAGVTVTRGNEFGREWPDSMRLNFSQNHAAAVRAAERMVLVIERYRADTH